MVTSILLHNSARSSELEARAAFRTKKSVREGFWWNIWKQRKLPFNDLENGSRIILVESWTGGGLFSWLVEATDVHTQVFSSKTAAVKAIAGWAGQSTSWVLSDPYTRDKPREAGVALFWRAKPIERLDLARPAGLKLGRNGWLSVDEATADGWGVPKSLTSRPSKPPNRGAGRRLDVAAKIAVEARAMAVAKQWMRDQAWTSIQDTSAGKSWDFVAVDKKGRHRYVEVKGTTGGLGKVEVTKGEVDAARQHGADHLMIIVHDIDLHARTGAPEASEGTLAVYDPWDPQEPELTGQRFDWKPLRRKPLTT